MGIASAQLPFGWPNGWVEELDHCDKRKSAESAFFVVVVVLLTWHGTAVIGLLLSLEGLIGYGTAKKEQK